ncbi:hypothetical protein SDC49_13630 [Lactobacillus sp. R2/2]|nr:hypothetical protein [Lactobacillus sp. R2/2]
MANQQINAAEKQLATQKAKLNTQIAQAKTQIQIYQPLPECSLNKLNKKLLLVNKSCSKKKAIFPSISRCHQENKSWQK